MSIITSRWRFHVLQPKNNNQHALEIKECFSPPAIAWLPIFHGYFLLSVRRCGLCRQ